MRSNNPAGGWDLLLAGNATVTDPCGQCGEDCRVDAAAPSSGVICVLDIRHR